MRELGKGQINSVCSGVLVNIVRNRVTPTDSKDRKVKVIALLDAGKGTKTTPMLFQADTPFVHRIVSAARRLMPIASAIAVSRKVGGRSGSGIL